MIVPVILSGGTGSRLWPLSRELYPKQLLPLVNCNTMLQNTALRTMGIEGIGGMQVVCNEEHRFMVAEQLRQAGVEPAAVILEPFGRNTAPAVAVAACAAISKGSNPVLLVLPADHDIVDVAAFQYAVAVGKVLAEAGKLITFGIVPQKPETGYGYIQAGKRLNNAGCSGSCSVEQFVEKPDRTTAERYLAAGNYFWNSGMFMFTAQRYLDELERFEPDILSACRRAYSGAARDKDFTRLEAESFATCPSNSIDYAVMERTTDAVVIPLDAGWSDVGSWSALWDIGEQDGFGNVIKGDALLHATRNCFISAQSRLVATVGLEDHVIVETKDAVLVARKDQVQDVKVIVNQLNAKKNVLKL